MIVDKYYAQQKKLHVGSTLRLIDHDWNISGIYEGGKLARICVKADGPAGDHREPGHLTLIYVKLDDPRLAAADCG